MAGAARACHRGLRGEQVGDAVLREVQAGRVGVHPCHPPWDAGHRGRAEDPRRQRRVRRVGEWLAALVRSHHLAGAGGRVGHHPCPRWGDVGGEQLADAGHHLLLRQGPVGVEVAVDQAAGGVGVGAPDPVEQRGRLRGGDAAMAGEVNGVDVDCAGRRGVDDRCPQGVVQQRVGLVDDQGAGVGRESGGRVDESGDQVLDDLGVVGGVEGGGDVAGTVGGQCREDFLDGRCAHGCLRGSLGRAAGAVPTRSTV